MDTTEGDKPDKAVKADEQVARRQAGPVEAGTRGPYREVEAGLTWSCLALWRPRPTNKMISLEKRQLSGAGRVCSRDRQKMSTDSHGASLTSLSYQLPA